MNNRYHRGFHVEDSGDRGAGFIGSNFIRHVLASGKDYSVFNYDKLTYAGNLENLASVANNPGYLFVKGDICDAGHVEAAMRDCSAVIPVLLRALLWES
jgi:dTDP-D-glucose 4,6-dehydratase